MNIPKKLGKYTVREQIGKGSMGIVYSGYDPFSDTNIAIKLALADSLNDKETGKHYRKMFFNEAYTAGLLKHENILEIYDAGVDNEHCYIVMELVEGGNTLKPYCRPDNLLSYEQVIEIIFKCAKALDYAHRTGVIHRDIKPTNILVGKDMDIKIADFSIAHLTSADITNTMPMGFIGSPRYMSPEQVQEDSLNNQTDLFSLGIVMYELLSGRHPFKANGFSRLIYKIIHEEQPKLSVYRSDVPKILEKIVHHALEKNKKKRYKSGLDLAADLSLSFNFLETPRQNLDDQEKLNLLRELVFFQGFPEPELWEILRSCIWQKFNPNNQIIVEGDIDNSFYIIISGYVEVYKHNTLVGALKVGDCFGEMGYLSKGKRTATIIAKDTVELMKLNSLSIEQLSIECQLRFSKIFLSTLVKRLSDTTAMYASGEALEKRA